MAVMALVCPVRFRSQQVSCQQLMRQMPKCFLIAGSVRAGGGPVSLSPLEIALSPCPLGQRRRRYEERHPVIIADVDAIEDECVQVRNQVDRAAEALHEGEMSGVNVHRGLACHTWWLYTSAVDSHPRSGIRSGRLTSAANVPILRSSC